MKTLGQLWTTKLSNKKIIAENANLMADIARNEKKAAVFLRKMKADVRKAINESIKRRKNTLFYQVPFYVVGSPAFREFTLWANEENLVVRYGGLVDVAKGGVKIQHAVLLAPVNKSLRKRNK